MDKYNCTLDNLGRSTVHRNTCCVFITKMVKMGDGGGETSSQWRDYKAAAIATVVFDVTDIVSVDIDHLSIIIDSPGQSPGQSAFAEEIINSDIGQSNTVKAGTEGCWLQGCSELLFVPEAGTIVSLACRFRHQEAA